MGGGSGSSSLLRTDSPLAAALLYLTVISQGHAPFRREPLKAGLSARTACVHGCA